MRFRLLHALAFALSTTAAGCGGGTGDGGTGVGGTGQGGGPTGSCFDDCVAATGDPTACGAACIPGAGGTGAGGVPPAGGAGGVPPAGGTGAVPTTGGAGGVGGVGGTGALPATGGAAGLPGTGGTAGVPGTGGTAGVPPTGGAGGVVGSDDPTVQSLEGNGPYTVQTYTQGLSRPQYGTATMHYPVGTPGLVGALVTYPGWLEQEDVLFWMGQRVGSHGFVVLTLGPVTVNDSPTQRAQGLIAGLQTLRDEAGNPSSPVFQQIDFDKFAITGHSMGGGGTLIAARQIGVQIKAAIPLAPYTDVGTNFSGITAATLVVAAQNDTIANAGTYAYPSYQSIGVTKAYMEVAGQGHFLANTGSIDLPIIGRYIIAWLKLYLDGDQRYAPFLWGPEHDADVAAGKFSRYEAVP